jgi:surface antigen
MIGNISRALRQAAGGGVILALGVGAASAQAPATVTTAAGAALPASNSASWATNYTSSSPDSAVVRNDERAIRMALRASLKATAAPVVAVRTLKAKTVRKPAVAVAALAPAAAPPAPAPAGPVVAPAGNSSGYAFGYCTWWVSHKRYIPWHANAAQWWSLARAYGFAEGSTPRVGAVMVMGYGVGGASASSGHVGYVESVNANGTFTISEMNWWGVAGGGWGKVDYRTVTSMAGILGFIY